MCIFYEERPPVSMSIYQDKRTFGQKECGLQNTVGASMLRHFHFSYYRTKFVLEAKIFDKLNQFSFGKSSFREVLNMIKGQQDFQA